MMKKEAGNLRLADNHWRHSDSSRLRGGRCWVVVSKIDTDTPKTEAVDDIIEYQDYEVENEEEVYEFVTELYAALSER
jgi:hypothetical protein